MSDIDRAQKRQDKIMRTIVRLKHSLAADEEIYQHRQRQRELLLEGEMPRLELNLTDLVDE